VEGAARGWRW